MQQPEVPPLESNAYAVSYRLLGDRPAALAVAGIAAERLRQQGDPLPTDWMARLIEFTIVQTIGPTAIENLEPESDPHWGMRTALRRRLEHATSQERVVGALVHLSGYPVESVSSMTGIPVEEVRSLAGVLAPPPGVHYRDLGDPELTGSPTTQQATSGRIRRPHWTTIVVGVVFILLVLYATQVTGPRPSFEGEGSMSATNRSAQIYLLSAGSSPAEWQT
ncbi:MAG TPA: hypothetical protein VL068_04150 [Microthrixaceae bacterium]|nr:hypothetical protein [Microthrixaceae bacterium]